jgi:asparagine synthase (glutamine-hydrolysing)
MCGLAGIVAWDKRFRVTRAILERMSARIAHRGPDGEGIYLNHDQEPSYGRAQCGLVHRRLAIIDLDPRALQPLDDGRETQWIVFNGEIYNYRELRSELETLVPDYAWRTTSDTEVLLVAARAWGERCVDHLNGMYAFAVWDEPTGTLLVARDRMGQKPLYYAVAPDHGAVAFASELAALREVPWVDTAVDRMGLADYLCWGYIPAPRTIYKGVEKLLPAHWLKWTANGRDGKRYYNPNLALREGAVATDAPEQLVRDTRRLVTQAVKRQLVADVPLGCFLSGGIDSSITAAAMKASVPPDQPVLTFSIGFDDPNYDETPYAASVARHLHTQHRQFTVHPKAAEDLPKLAAVYGEPFGDSSALPTHYLSRETRQHVKVALSGDGGDELFGGYDRYRAMALGQRLRHLPRPFHKMLAAQFWQKLLPGTHPKSRLTRLKRFLKTIDDEPRRRYASYMRLFDDTTLWNLLDPSLHQPWYASRDWLSGEYGSFWTRDDVRAALAVDRVTYLPEDLLAKVDRASMLHALEVRSPFMDHELVTFASMLSADHLLLGGGKRMLREAFRRDLPRHVFSRRKMGFAVPIGQWLRKDLRCMLHDLLFAADSFASSHFDKPVLEALVEEHQHHELDHSQRLYGLLMLELWWRSAR